MVVPTAAGGLGLDNVAEENTESGRERPQKYLFRLEKKERRDKFSIEKMMCMPAEPSFYLIKEFS